MKKHGNACNPGPYAALSGTVQAQLWPAVKGQLSEKEMQRLSEGAGCTETMERLRRAFTTQAKESISFPPCPFFADEEVPSDYGYPPEFDRERQKTPVEQLLELGKVFPLDYAPTLAYLKQLPARPLGAEGPYPYVYPKWQRIAKTYGEALERMLAAYSAKLNGKLKNCREGKLGSEYLRQEERTVEAERMLGKEQEGDYLVVWAQFGFLHRGRSHRRARACYLPHEFGLGAFAGNAMLFTHPNRIVRAEQLFVDLSGDRYAPEADGGFSMSPYFYFRDGDDFVGGGVGFGTYFVGSPYDVGGSVSGFLSQ